MPGSTKRGRRQQKAGVIKMSGIFGPLRGYYGNWLDNPEPELQKPRPDIKTRTDKNQSQSGNAIRSQEIVYLHNSIYGYY